MSIAYILLRFKQQEKFCPIIIFTIETIPKFKIDTEKERLVKEQKNNSKTKNKMYERTLKVLC